MEVEVRLLFQTGLLSSVDLTFKNLKNGASFILGIAIASNDQHSLLLVLLNRRVFAVSSLYNGTKKISDEEDHLPLLGTKDYNDKLIEVHDSKDVAPKNTISVDLEELLSHVHEGFAAGYEPELCEEGVNGTYFLRDKSGQKIAVFKPQDEQGDTNNNPKNSSRDDYDDASEPLGKGLREGEVVQREVAAYMIDRNGFSHVPPTMMVSLAHSKFNKNDDETAVSKTGSLQKFVIHDGCSEDISVNAFPVKEVHRIGVLDLQLFNMDRHGGNILFKKDSKDGSYTLYPIDHGFSLPEYTSLGNAWFDWLNWPQAKQSFDKETKNYIENIDLDANLKMLERELGIRKECLNTMKISTTLLKKGAANELTLYDIASIVCREDIEKPSTLEIWCEKAREMATAAGEVDNDELFFKYLFQVMDEEIAKMK